MSESVERKSISLSLCGNSFVFDRPVRRVCRQMLRDIFAIQQKYPSVGANAHALLLKKQLTDEGEHEKAADVVVPPTNPMEGLALVDDALDFLYKWHKDIDAKKAEIDDATETEISSAFSEVTQFLMRPFAQVQAIETSTPNPESTS